MERAAQWARRERRRLARRFYFVAFKSDTRTKDYEDGYENECGRVSNGQIDREPNSEIDLLRYCNIELGNLVSRRT